MFHATDWEGLLYQAPRHARSLLSVLIATHYNTVCRVFNTRGKESLDCCNDVQCACSSPTDKKIATDGINKHSEKPMPP